MICFTLIHIFLYSVFTIQNNNSAAINEQTAPQVKNATGGTELEDAAQTYIDWMKENLSLEMARKDGFDLEKEINDMVEETRKQGDWQYSVL